MIIDKRSKIVIGIIMFLELLFLVRAYFIYSFLTNDSLTGDGVHNPAKYDREFFLTVVYSILIMILLLVISIFIFSKRTRKI